MIIKQLITIFKPLFFNSKRIKLKAQRLKTLNINPILMIPAKPPFFHAPSLHPVLFWFSLLPPAFSFSFIPSPLKITS